MPTYLDYRASIAMKPVTAPANSFLSGIFQASGFALYLEKQQ